MKHTGIKGSRGILYLIGGLLVICCAVMAGPAPAMAQNVLTGIFELDGNSYDDPAVAGEDFDTIWNAYNGTGTTDALKYVFIPDFNTPDSSYFASGPKDTDLINPVAPATGTPLQCVTINNPLNKDDVLSAYAAAYTNTGGDEMVAFGADRGTNNGDANFGFWFFQRPISCDSSVNNGYFNGHKTGGDLFIVSTFTQGGGVSTVSVYEWTDPDGIAENGDECLADGVDCTAAHNGVPLITGNDCVQSVETSQYICATVNSQVIQTAWRPNVLTNIFYEGGVNLTHLIGNLGCYASFMSETRSSQSLTATIKDYALGKLSTCGSITAVKTTVPSGSTQAFNFSLNPDPYSAGTQSLSDTQQYTWDSLKKGTYTLSEAAATGWDLTAIDCGDKVATTDLTAGTAALDLAPNEDIVCTFTNTKRGQIIIEKKTVGADGDFDFTSAKLGDFNLSTNSNDATRTFGNLLPGSYAVAESVPAGWDLANATCSDGDDPGSITLVAGQSVTCTFTNVKKPQITITPSAYNEVGTSHTFTVTVSQGANGLSGIKPAVAFSPSNPGSVTDNCASTGTNSSGQCTVLINSTTAGTFSASASASFSISGVSYSISTNGTGSNSGPAVKTYVDGGIALSPLTATNAVGRVHTITAETFINNGTTAETPAAGVTVNFSLSNNTAGATFTGNNYCVSNATGYCSVQITSSNPGTVTINASTTLNVGGVTFTRATNGNAGPNGTGPAVKNYVNARISIGNTATNLAGTQHTFTVTVEEDNGSGFAGLSGVNPAVAFSPTNPGSVTDNCAATGTNSSGQCTVVINNTLAGTFSASASLTISGINLTISTNGIAPNSGPAVKTYVDGGIALSPLTATDPVGHAHTITAEVYADNGTTVETPAAGVTVTFSLSSNTAGASFVGGNNTCISNTSGFCSVQINSTAPGGVVINASATLTVGGVTFTRATNGNAGPNGTGPASKTYVAGQIVIQKVTNPSGDPQLFTFTPSYGSQFTLTGGTSANSGYIAPGTYSVSETAVTGWDLTGATCDNGNSPASITVSSGSVITCTFTNTKRGTVSVTKTLSGTTPGQGFTFEIRTGASVSSLGTILVSDVTDASGLADFGGTLFVPGTYQFCEDNMAAGFHSSLSDDTSSFVPGGTDNSAVCVNFTLDPGEAQTFTVNDTPPPGGDARTIGYWKNWGSCSSGGKRTTLDGTLSGFPIAAGQTTNGVFVGKLYVDTCLEAVDILAKSTVTSPPKNMASDAAYNLAAQLLAADLNIQAGAGSCAAATSAITQGQALLTSINFRGTTGYLPAKAKNKAVRNHALSLANTLDLYNNNELCQ